MPVEYAPIPEVVQMAWVSPAGARVGAHGQMIVVRASELLALAGARRGDAVGVLSALGVGRAGGEWKVTIFDVDRAELCRPVEGEGALAGLNRCPTARRPARTRPVAWTGEGYVNDADTGDRTFDVYGIEWADAANEGFCVLPLSRFLSGPP